MRAVLLNVNHAVQTARQIEVIQPDPEVVLSRVEKSPTWMDFGGTQAFALMGRHFFLPFLGALLAQWPWSTVLWRAGDAKEHSGEQFSLRGPIRKVWSPGARAFDSAAEW